MIAQTIDDVLSELELIVNDALQADDRIGYFAGLYLRVTWAVKRAIVAGDVFDDNERMAQLDTIFANRFLEAWAADDDSEWLTAPWDQAFEALDRDDLMVVQHLAMGMNAHINLDLGIAAEQVMAERDEPLDALEADFNRINDVLSRLTRVVQVQLAQLSPAFDVLEDIAPELQAAMFGKVLDAVRGDAWSFAKSLDEAEDDETYEQLIEERAALTEGAGELILLPSAFSDFVSKVVSGEREHSVRHNIQILAE